MFKKSLKTKTFFSDGCNTYYLKCNINNSVTFELKDTISFYRLQAQNREVTVDVFDGRLYLYLNGISSIVEVDLVEQLGCMFNKKFIISKYNSLTSGSEFAMKYQIKGKLTKCENVNWNKIVDFLEKN